MKSTLALVLAAAAAAAVAATDSLSYNVVQAVMFHRHGDRSPTGCLPKQSHECPSYWPDGFGQLTPRGMHQLYTLGADHLRPRYVNELGMLPANWSRSALYVRSTDYDRTLQSVDSLLQGLYPPGTGPTLWGEPHQPAVTAQRIQVVPVVTLPRVDDGVLTWDASVCPAWNTARNAYTAQVEADSGEVSALSHIITELGDETGVADLNINTVYKVLDGLKTDKFHGFPWPAGVDEAQFDAAINASQWTMSLWYGTPAMRRLGGGFMVSAIRDSLVARANGTAQPNFDPTTYASPTGEQLTGPRMAIYSAHDITLLTLLASLGVLQGPVENPPYASSTVFELVEVPSAASTGGDPHAVRIWYNKGIGTNGTSGFGTPEPFNPSTNIMALPGCSNVGAGSDILCPLQEFLALTADVSNPDWQVACDGAAPTSAKSKDKFTEMQVILGSAIGSVLGLVVGFLVAYCCCRRAAQPAGGTGAYGKL